MPTTNTAPVAITDFTASTDEHQTITFTWTDLGSTPAPTYDLWDLYNVITSTVTTGYILDVLGGGSTWYHIKATNVDGYAISNSAEGIALPPAEAPGNILDFAATDDELGRITFTWSDTTGSPVPIYDLWDTSGEITTGVTSGYSIDIEGTDNYYIKATNTEGDVDSNIDNGTGAIVPGNVTDFTASDNIHGKIEFTWTDDTAGLPVATYDLYNTGFLESGITSGYLLDILGMDNYYIKVINSVGSTYSNSDYGEGLPPKEIPGDINNFKASNDINNEIQFTWTDTSGSPVPTYDLYDDANTIIDSNIISGYSITAPTLNPDEYYIKAINTEGEVDSNRDTGEMLIEPSAIIDFDASEDELGKITFTWSDATGYPEPTYNLYNSAWLIRSGVTSGYSIDIDGTNDYYVKAKNSAGWTLSNEDSGTGLEAPSRIIDFEATDGEPGQITFTWSDAIGTGPMVYSLYDSKGLVTAPVTSDDSITIEGQETYYIIATDANGATQSNVDVGIGGTIVTWDDNDSFGAIDNLNEKIIFTWTNATGSPEPIYSLYNSLGAIAGFEDVASGVTYPVVGTEEYHIVASNGLGTPIESNHVTATSIGIINLDITWHSMENYTSIDINGIMKYSDNGGATWIEASGNFITPSYQSGPYILREDYDNLGAVTGISFRGSDAENITGSMTITGGTRLTSANGMFDGLINLTDLDVSEMDTSHVTNMEHMFFNCRNLTALDIVNFDISKVTTTKSMFGSCNNLTSISLKDLNIERLLNMQEMFFSCDNLKSVVFTNLDFGNVNDMQHLFDDCVSLECITNIDTTTVTFKEKMFENTPKLVEPDKDAQEAITHIPDSEDPTNGKDWMNSGICP